MKIRRVLLGGAVSRLVTAIAVTLLPACGGGGGGSTITVPPVTTPPSPGVSLLAGFLYGNPYVDATGTAARFNRPAAMVVDSFNNIWVEDVDPSVDESYGNGRETALRVVNSSGAVTTAARNARPTALINGTTYSGLLADGYGNAYELASGGLSPVGPGIGPPFSTLNPPVAAPNLPNNRLCQGVNGSESCFFTMDRQGTLYGTEQFPVGSSMLVKLSAGLPEVSLATSQFLGWTDGGASTATYTEMASLVFDANGTGYFVDGFTPPFGGAPEVAIRSFNQQGIFSTQLSNSVPLAYVDGGHGVALLKQPAGLQVDAAGSLYFSDIKVDTTGATILYIRKLAPSGTVSTVAGPFSGVSIAGTNPTLGFVVDSGGNIYLFQQSQLNKIAPGGVRSAFAGLTYQTGSQDGLGNQARFAQPLGVAADAFGNTYVADCGAHTVRKIDSSGHTTTLAGSAGQTGNMDGVGAAARFNCPRGIVADAFGNIYVTQDNDQNGWGGLRKIDAQSGAVTTLTATKALTASGLAVDANGKVYANDLVNNALRVYDPKTQTLVFLAQGSFNYGFNAIQNPGEFRGIAVDTQGNVYILGPSDGKVRKVDPQGGVTNLPGAGGAISLASTAGLTIDAAGNLYVADTLQHVIRKIAPDGTMTTVAGVPTSYYAVPGALPGSLGNPVGIAQIPGKSDTQLVVSDENAVLSIVLP